MRFDLPQAAPVRLQLLDVRGRIRSTVEEQRPAGPQEILADTQDLAPGVYLARLTVHQDTEVVRFVRTR